VQVVHLDIIEYFLERIGAIDLDGSQLLSELVVERDDGKVLNGRSDTLLGDLRNSRA
jgi:hypothetical protein